MWLMSISLCGCSGEDDNPSQDLNILVDCQDINFTVIPESITPVSATFKSLNQSYLDVIISKDEQMIKNVISQVKKFGYSDLNYPNIQTVGLNYVSGSTIYDLQSSSTYYYVGVVADQYSNEIKISPIKEFTTDEINLYVDLEGSDVIWCGVNFLKDRHVYAKEYQFLESTLYYQYSLPSPTEETIDGNWRFPTKDELKQLCKVCHITLLDFNLNLARLTDCKGTHLYVPFTSYIPNMFDSELVCFPCKGASNALGLCASKLSLGAFSWGGIMRYNPYYGNALDKLAYDGLRLYDDVYRWRYLDNDNKEHSGTAKRAVRFVMDK